MAKREYRGPPIDGTEQYITERPFNDGGETVAGTSEDDVFEESTEWIPEDVSLTDKQKEAAKAFLRVPDRESITLSELAEGRDFSKETAERAIHKVFRSRRGLEDIKASSRLAVLIWAHEGSDASRSELAEEYPLSERALGDAIRVYPDLIDEYSPIDGDDLETAIEKYKENHQRPTKSSDDSDGSEGKNGKFQKAKEEKEYPDDFSECYQWFIETISENPSLQKADVKSKIPDEKDWSGQNYYNVVRDYPHIIKQRIADKQSVDSWNDACDYILKHVRTVDDDIDSVAEESLDEHADSDAEQKSGSNEDAEGGDAEDTESVDITTLEHRVRAVESKLETMVSGEVDTLRKRVRKVESDIKELDAGVDPGELEADGGEVASNRLALAEIIVESCSDEELGQLVRDVIRDE